MSTITRAPEGRYCDLCKARWGKLKDGSLHVKAQKQAVIVISTFKRTQTIERAYCAGCRDYLSRWSDGSIWPLSEQLNYAKEHAHNG
jgi:DNA-binding NarL/FixJ family response regulator